MKASMDPWGRLAALASKGPRHPPAADPAHVAAVAAAALRTATLARPGTVAVVLGWLAVPRIRLLILAVVLGSAIGYWATRPSPAKRAAARYAGWSSATLRHLAAWYPIECSDAGEIGLLLRRREEELRRLPPSAPEVRELLLSTEQELRVRLTPEQREAFADAQRELRRKWFPHLR